MRNRAGHYYHKIANIGVFRAVQVVGKRAYKKAFFYLFSRGWYRPGGKAQGPAWDAFINTMRGGNLFYLQKPSKEVDPALIAFADRWVAYALTLQAFDHRVPWYTDTRWGKWYFFDSHSLYATITIKQNNDLSGGPDIKVPWDLARFQFLPIL